MEAVDERRLKLLLIIYQYIGGTQAINRGTISGSGSPSGVYYAAVGTMYIRTDGGSSTTLYIKESGTGNTGWVAK
jgi:hypothetical protein